ncbi:glycoside hydrolase family 3 protein [Nocardia iowensis]|uniref:Glycoside hydrolase family 3 C-terminal domain-containing protein n=1 Tax=Nocardia iowensis TaxID=204891 RepID=A0ABX8RQU5_NOCIO|nr:glycoside hydrolase family 3 C-terminal domain-containing protein [Nocardia iowensis]QXN92018.1 glycoside hydrolase family 3 C-terminal domain-containing protein [Nocardia iowensis]
MSQADVVREEAVTAALGKLDLPTKARLLMGQDMWSLPALPEIGLRSLVMSDGPIGVRGVRFSADDPSIALPSPTALAATWDPELARRAGLLLAQEARRKGVQVLLAPTVNLHRSPLGGRHFEAYSEDPYLTGRIGTGYVRGVQDGGVGTTVKHFVANDAETERFTVNNVVSPRALRELYLAPFEAIVREAGPWGIMAAYNQVNGTTMTEHAALLNGVLRDEWGYDGVVVSDWIAARSTVGAITGGLDIAMPGPRGVYGDALVAAVRNGEVEESVVDAAVRRVLRLAARVGLLDGAEPAVTTPPANIDGIALAREIAGRSFVLVRNAAVADRTALPIDAADKVALIGLAARDARILGGGSATVFPESVVSPLDGLTAALPEDALTFAVGATPSDALGAADQGFELQVRVLDADGEVLGISSLPNGMVEWIGEMPDGISYDALHTVEIHGTFTPRESGAHVFGTKGFGEFRLVVADTVLFDGSETPSGADLFEAFFGTPVERGTVELTAGQPVEVRMTHSPMKFADAPIQAVNVTLAHGDPRRDPDELIAEAVEAARAADVAVVVVATTEQVESEGFDRKTLKLPGRQDELVSRVAAVNPNTVVVVNAGSPVELPWREEVAAILLSWFPGQQGGAALADVLLGHTEPGGRLPTTWPIALADCPVTEVVPTDGELVYREDVFIGYRAWERAGTTPAYPFGHGSGYTTWDYESIERDATTVTVQLRNTGARRGAEVVQIYIAPVADSAIRPSRWLAGFTRVEADPGEQVAARIRIPQRAFEIWDEERNTWRSVPGTYEIQAGHSSADRRLATRYETK